MYHTLLVATDGSELSSHAVKASIHLASSTGAKLIILKVVGYAPEICYEGVAIGATDDLSALDKEINLKAQAVVDEAQAQAAASGVQATTVIVKSDAIAEAIIETAKTHNADMLIMASHGRRGIARLLLGSETMNVLTHSDIPVLVVK